MRPARWTVRARAGTGTAAPAYPRRDASVPSVIAVLPQAQPGADRYVIDIQALRQRFDDHPRELVDALRTAQHVLIHVFLRHDREHRAVDVHFEAIVLAQVE